MISKAAHDEKVKELRAAIRRSEQFGKGLAQSKDRFARKEERAKAALRAEKDKEKYNALREELNASRKETKEAKRHGEEVARELNRKYRKDTGTILQWQKGLERSKASTAKWFPIPG